MQLTPEQFPYKTFDAIREASPEERKLIALYLECSDEVQSAVDEMYVILRSENSSSEDKYRAVTTIADALYPNSTEGHGRYGMDLEQVQRDTASKHPEASRRPLIEKRLEQLDSQEATFAGRLKQLLGQKSITQEELADRLGLTQSAISKMLSRNCRPQKKTIMKIANALNVPPTDLWPDLEVVAILDTVAKFQEDQTWTEEQSANFEANLPAQSKQKGKRLPSRKEK